MRSTEGSGWGIYTYMGQARMSGISARCQVGAMDIRDSLTSVREQMHAACAMAGRADTEVALMAVSKVHPVEYLLEAFAAGQRLFGENRVQEFQAKFAEIGAALEMSARPEVHLIGPLQNNKTTKAAEIFDGVDSVDSVKTAQRLGSSAATLGRVLPILVEVKLSPEESKHGVAPEDLDELLDGLAGVEGLAVRGLMAVPPWSEDPEEARPYFRRLRELRDRLRGRYPELGELSMGMSNDFMVAIEEGSTCVRIGTAIFGRRKQDAA